MQASLFKVALSANQHGHFARCRGCDLNVLCWHAHGSYVADEPPVQGLLPQELLAIGDSGCKTAVGGLHWHQRFQHELQRRGLTWTTVQEAELFKFGAGEPIQSQVAHIYPIGLHGHNSWVRMSVVEKDAVDCPGLIGPADMARWHVVFKFHDRQMVAMGVSHLTATRHPGLNLFEYGNLDEFQTDGALQELYEQLRTFPYRLLL